MIYIFQSCQERHRKSFEVAASAAPSSEQTSLHHGRGQRAKRFVQQVDRSPPTGVPGHQVLGVSYEAAMQFLLEDLKVVVPNRDPGRALPAGFDRIQAEDMFFVQGRFKWIKANKLRSGRSYIEKEAWLAEAHPDTLTCYDINSCIRERLKREGEENKSVCEVLLSAGSGSKPAAGQAGVFISHVQSEHPSDTMKAMRKLDREIGGKFQWLDSFSLKQCQQDFKPESIVALIKWVGHTHVICDWELSYPKRSFCVLELYASVQGKAKLNMSGKGIDFRAWSVMREAGKGLHRVQRALEDRQSPHLRDEADPQLKEFLQKLEIVVDTANATTRRQQDKEMIDKYITENVEGGHDKLNQVMEGEIRNAMKKSEANNRKAYAQTGFIMCCPKTFACCNHIVGRGAEDREDPDLVITQGTSFSDASDSEYEYFSGL